MFTALAWIWKKYCTKWNICQVSCSTAVLLWCIFLGESGFPTRSLFHIPRGEGASATYTFAMIWVVAILTISPDASIIKKNPQVQPYQSTLNVQRWLLIGRQKNNSQCDSMWKITVNCHGFIMLLVRYAFAQYHPSILCWWHAYGSNIFAADYISACNLRRHCTHHDVAIMNLNVTVICVGLQRIYFVFEVIFMSFIFDMAWSSRSTYLQNL